MPGTISLSSKRAGLQWRRVVRRGLSRPSPGRYFVIPAVLRECCVLLLLCWADHIATDAARCVCKWRVHVRVAKPIASIPTVPGCFSAGHLHVRISSEVQALQLIARLHSSDNHDNARFLNVQSDVKKYQAAITYVLFGEGIPIIYYGTEQVCSCSEQTVKYAFAH